MKNTKALKILQNRIKLYVLSEDSCALGEAMKALDKQIQKKSFKS